MFINKLDRSRSINLSHDSLDSTLHSQNFMLGLEDSGIATSNDVHSIVFDDHPLTPPPTVNLDNKVQCHHMCSILNGTIEVKKSSGPGSQSHFSINSNISTIRQHYYPETGWGFVILIIGIIVQTLTHGLQMCVGILLLATKNVFKIDDIFQLGNFSASLLDFSFQMLEFDRPFMS